MTAVADTDAPTQAPAEPPAGPPVAGPADAGLLVVALAALVVGAGLTATARAGALALLVGVGIVQALLALAWPLGTTLPGRRGAVVVGALAAAGADVATSLYPHGRLGVLLPVLGLALPVMFVHQLTRGAARVQLVSSLSGTAVLVVGEVALAALLQLRHEVSAQLDGRAAAAVAAAAAGAVLAGALVDVVLPMPRFDPAVARGMLGLLVAAGVGAAAAQLLLRDAPGFDGGRALFLGAAVGALAGLLAVAASFLHHTTVHPTARLARPLAPTFVAVLPISLVAPAGLLLTLAIRA